MDLMQQKETIQRIPLSSNICLNLHHLWFCPKSTNPQFDRFGCTGIRFATVLLVKKIIYWIIRNCESEMFVSFALVKDH